MAGTSRTVALLRAAHPGPAAAVTVLSAAFAASVGLSPGRVALVTSAVLAGQLSIGWCNDLVDAERDRSVGRQDKPIALGEVSPRLVRAACGVAVAAMIPLSLACGLVAGAVHVVLVAAGWSYDLGVKATLWSWVPYAVAFAGLPVFIVLCEPGAGLPPVWLPAAGALLGIGAHLVNVLPDLADDEATGVRGLPHRIGARWTPVAAVAFLGGATVLLASGTRLPAPVLVAALATVAALAGVALVGRGRLPFQAAIGIAAVDVLLLVVAG